MVCGKISYKGAQYNNVEDHEFKTRWRTIRIVVVILIIVIINNFGKYNIYKILDNTR